MGGNAFPGLSVVRIHRDSIRPTVDYIVNTLNIPGFDIAYAMDNMMGSAGKQDSSGDLDFAMNNYRPRFVGEPDLPLFKLSDVATRARAVLPEGHVITKSLKGGQFQTAFPIAGMSNLGYVQVDFIAGKPEWLKFSHYSPGKDLSPFKGVMLSTMLGVLAKMRKDFELLDLEGRAARVGLRFDLEKGLYRRWEVRKRSGQGLSQVSADEFETSVATSPRFVRLYEVTAPYEVLSLLLGVPTELGEVDTFEKLVSKIKTIMPDRFDEARERFLEAFQRSAGVNDYSIEEVESSDVWL